MFPVVKSTRSDRFHRFRSLALLLVTTVAVMLAPARAEAGQSFNMGAALRWHGWVETDLAFSEFFSGNHTIMARFMPQYVRAYRGPILGVRRPCPVFPCKPEGPSFSLGMGDYAEGTNGAKLVLELGGVRRTYLAPGMASGHWQHVALRREKTRDGKVMFRVYLNGTQLCADPALYSTCNLTLAWPALPIGTVRLGRTAATGAVSQPATKQQFYGFIDDVAVFKKALPPDEIAALADKTFHPRLTGWEANLFAGWTFDDATPTDAPLPAVLARPVTYANGSYKWPFLSQARDDDFDDDHLPLARPELAMDLPFPQGQAWKISQGWGGTASHYGVSAFAIDAFYQDGSTLGQKVHASAAGKIAYVNDTCPFPSDDPACQKNGEPANPNIIQIRVAPGVVVSYLHIGKGSTKTPFGGQVPTVGTPVGARAYIAKVGKHPNGAHMHFGVNTNAKGEPNTVSIAVVYRNYEVWNEANGTWDFVQYGVPRKGQVVRVP